MDNRTFWKTVVSFFTKNRQKVKILLLLMTVIKAFITFFSNDVSNLDIPNPSNYFKEAEFHSLSDILEHFEKHPCVSNIKNKNSEYIFLSQRPPLKK